MNEMNYHVMSNATLTSLAPHFVDETRHLSAEQVNAHPEIDDVVCHLLEGNELKDALIFIDNVRANRMKIRWSAVNVWSVYYKHMHVCDIRLEKGSWSVSQNSEHIDGRVYYFSDSSECMIWLARELKGTVTEDQKLLKAS